MSATLLTPALLGGAQILLGVHAFHQFQKMMSADKFVNTGTHEFSNKSLGTFGYYLKAGSHLLTAISVLALRTLHLLIAHNVLGLGSLLVFQGALAPITLIGVGIVSANFAFQLLGAVLIRASIKNPGPFMRQYECRSDRHRGLELDPS